MRTDAVREIGGFCESLLGAAYEDLEWAWRLRERFGMPVVYRPAAVVTHDHRYEPTNYLSAMLLDSATREALAVMACGEFFGRWTWCPRSRSRCARSEPRAPARRASALLPFVGLGGPGGGRGRRPRRARDVVRAPSGRSSVGTGAAGLVEAADARVPALAGERVA
ncbi:MAG: hypothetical protein R3B49_00225 [Phycisphaerales bacterium]